MTQKNAWNTYDVACNEYFKTYESFTFESVHSDFLKFLPAPGAMCLDVGAGSGRDAAALAQRGYEVIAVEPSNGLRKLAQTHHPHPHIKWVADTLPYLTTLKDNHYLFDFVLVSAVWMHVQPELRLTSLQNLKDLLTQDGCIALTLRLGDPSVERVIFPLSVNEIFDQAKQVGLKVLYESPEETDSLGRQDVKWKKVVLANF